MIDMKLEVGGLTAEVQRLGASPGRRHEEDDDRRHVHARTILDNIPTARDPWQIINMAPGVIAQRRQRRRLGVRAAAHADRLRPQLATSQWNIEGGNTTDMASNSSASYYNFDSFQEIQVVTGGGDVSVQSSGLFINLVTKSGSNVVQGHGHRHVRERRRCRAERDGGAVQRGRLERHGSVGQSAATRSPTDERRVRWSDQDATASGSGAASTTRTSTSASPTSSTRPRPECVPPPTRYEQLQAVQGCLENDKTVIQDHQRRRSTTSSTRRTSSSSCSRPTTRCATTRGASANTAPEATYQQVQPERVVRLLRRRSSRTR